MYIQRMNKGEERKGEEGDGEKKKKRKERKACVGRGFMRMRMIERRIKRRQKG